MNRNSAVMDQKSIRQCKADQARILEQFNTPYYSILVSVNIRVINIAGVWSRRICCLMNKWVACSWRLISGSFIISKWKAVVFFSIPNV